MSMRSMSILVLSFSIVITLMIGNLGSSYHEIKTLNSNSEKTMHTVDAFSDLSRNTTLNGPGTGP